MAAGTVNGGTYFVETSGTVTLGTTPILFAAEQKRIVWVDTIAEQMNKAVINAFMGGFF